MYRKRRPRGPLPSRAQILNVAKDVISTLEQTGVDACFMGSMACTLFGTTRKPNDLDVLCLTSTWEQEDLKRHLVESNSSFYLIPSRDPSATYKVLWYHIGDTDSCVKIDLLFPGVLDIPDVPLPYIERDNTSSLPCMPLSLLLLLKLQGWIHHGESAIWRYRSKQPADVCDVNELLSIARRRGLLPITEPYLTPVFVSRAESRVLKYIRSYPHSKEHWMVLGFTCS